MRTQLDNATRLDRLIPIHEHLCQLDARERYRPAITNSGLDPIDQAALQSSPAFGPLITALRRAEHLRLDIPTTLHQAVNQSSLTNANDLASVLHARVERLTTRAERRTRRTPPTLIAGLITPAIHVSNPTYRAALRELESQIAQRADWLAEQAGSADEPWYGLLIASLSDTTDRRRQLIRDIAAYRERYQVQAPDPLGSAPLTDHVHQRHRSRLKQLLGETLGDRVDSVLEPETPDAASSARSSSTPGPTTVS
ncbi:MAG: hypothetical protein HOV67_22070 [Kribbellaceae bacterium]|nr:hypothetical protein [Kribbellaceae bacterium]